MSPYFRSLRWSSFMWHWGPRFCWDDDNRAHRNFSYLTDFPGGVCWSDWHNGANLSYRFDTWTVRALRALAHGRGFQRFLWGGDYVAQSAGRFLSEPQYSLLAYG